MSYIQKLNEVKRFLEMYQRGELGSTRGDSTNYHITVIGALEQINNIIRAEHSWMDLASQKYQTIPVAAPGTIDSPERTAWVTQSIALQVTVIQDLLHQNRQIQEIIDAMRIPHGDMGGVIHNLRASEPRRVSGDLPQAVRSHDSDNIKSQSHSLISNLVRRPPTPKKDTAADSVHSSDQGHRSTKSEAAGPSRHPGDHKRQVSELKQFHKVPTGEESNAEVHTSHANQIISSMLGKGKN